MLSGTRESPHSNENPANLAQGRFSQVFGFVVRDGSCGCRLLMEYSVHSLLVSKGKKQVEDSGEWNFQAIFLLQKKVTSLEDFILN